MNTDYCLSLFSMSIASALALRYQYDIRASQELVALGTANIVGSIFHSYVVGKNLFLSSLERFKVGLCQLVVFHAQL